MSGISGLEWIMILLSICIPLLVILGLVGVGIYVYDRNRSTARQNQVQFYPSGSAPATAAPMAGHYCSHCGVALQSDWTYCPHCGAVIP